MYEVHRKCNPRSAKFNAFNLIIIAIKDGGGNKTKSSSLRARHTIKQGLKNIYKKILNTLLEKIKQIDFQLSVSKNLLDEQTYLSIVSTHVQFVVNSFKNVCKFRSYTKTDIINLKEHKLNGILNDKGCCSI